MKVLNRYFIPYYKVQGFFKSINKKKLKSNPLRWVKANKRHLKAVLISILSYLFKSVSIKWIDHNIEGYLKFYEAIALNKIARRLSNNSTIVEIGAYLGRSTCFIAEAIKNKKINFYSIDTFENQGMPEGLKHTYRDYYKNIYRYRNNVKIIKGFSYNVVKEFKRKNIDMLWVDADHSYEACKKDNEGFYYIPELIYPLT